MPSLLKISGNENKVIGGNGKLFESAGIPVTESASPATPGTFGANARGKAFFEGAIAAEWRKNVTAIIRVGQLLNQAKEELDRDVFAALKLPFSLRVSQMLRAIANHPIISDAKHASLLPACWATLYELTKVDDETLLAAIADGRINPTLQRKDIRSKILGLPPRTRQKATTPKLADVWLVSDPEEKRRLLNQEGRKGLAEILSSTLVAEIRDHALAQQELADRALLEEISSTSIPRKNVVNDLRVVLTRLVREIASAPTPERRMNAVNLLVQKCAVSNLHPSKLVVGHRDYAPPLTAQRAAKRKGARDL